jgi:hypothetical protein
MLKISTKKTNPTTQLPSAVLTSTKPQVTFEQEKAQPIFTLNGKAVLNANF